MPTNNQTNYFDLTTTGTGFVNKVRKIKPTGATSYFALTIAALRGKADDDGKVAKTYIDCNVVGSAIDMIKDIEAYFADGNKPTLMIKFVAGDLELRSFTYNSGDRKGQTGFALKARLFDIKWYKVDGEIFYSEAEQKRHDASKIATDENDKLPADQSVAPDSQAHIDVDSQQNQSAMKVDLPRQVKLVDDDPYFEERKKQLVDNGYHLVPDINLWILPETAAA